MLPISYFLKVSRKFIVKKNLQSAKIIPDLESFQRDTFCENICKKCNIVVREPFVSCAECYEIFCLACFAKGSETKKHRSDHDYKIQRDDFNLFGSDWTAREEKVFLNAILICGVGNWEEISFELKGKSPDE